MAIYRIYPNKDTFISSETDTAYRYANAGLDEIVELGGFPDANFVGRSKRILTQYSDEDIAYAINNVVQGNPYTASIHYTLADASEVPTGFSTFSYPISSFWENGTGKIDNKPITQDGVNWKFKDGALTEWNQLGGDFISSSNYISSQSYQIGDNLDIDIEVTNTVDAINSGSINNYGHLIKLEDKFENYTTSSISLKYFSKDTNTIYPPYLEFKWDDSIYSSSLDVLSTDTNRMHIRNLRPFYHDSDIAKIRIDARPRYPKRTFTTSSVNTGNYKLPEGSMYAIKDDFSEKMIVDFDESATRISADNTSSFFNIYMKILQPERYYNLLVKTTIDGNTVIHKSSTFKVVRNG